MRHSPWGLHRFTEGACSRSCSSPDWERGRPRSGRSGQNSARATSARDLLNLWRRVAPQARRNSGYRRNAHVANTTIVAAIPPMAHGVLDWRAIQPAANEPTGFIPTYTVT